MNLTILQKYKDILDKLQTAWQEVQTTDSLRVVLLEGESGMCKTGLVESFLSSSQAPNIAGYGAEIPEAYLPLRLAFESLIDIGEIQEQLNKPPREVSPEWQMTLTAFARLLPLMNMTEDPRWKLLKGWQPSELGPSLSSDRLEADEPLKPVTLPGLFTVALGELSTQFPFVFFIDNLNLTDTATLETLRFEILPSLKNIPVCFVANFEPLDELSAGPFSELLEFVRGMPETKHFRLPLLSEEEIEVLLRDRIPGVDLAALTPQIYEAAERKLAQVQDIVHWLDSLDISTPEELPDVLEHTTLIRRQFELLPSFEQTLLQMASVQGLYFCLESVACALNRDFEEVAKPFDQSDEMSFFARVDTTVILEDQQVHWCHFRGRNKRTWIYESIPGEQRVEYYRRIAFALERVYGDDLSSVAGLLARYFERGEVHEDAAHYFAQIAERSNAQGAADQALDYAERGLDNLEAVDDPGTDTLKCELLIQKGRALQNTGQAHRAVEILRDALEISQSLEGISLQMAAIRYLGEALLSLNAWDEGMARLTRAVEIAAEQKQWDIVANGMEVLRDRYYKRGESEEFFRLCNGLVSTLREEASPRALMTIAEILEDKGWLFYQQRKNDEALESFKQALERLKMLPDPSLYPEIHYKIHRYRAEVLRLLTDYPKALQETDKAIEWASATRSRGKQALARQTKATVLLDVKRYEEGKQVYERALDLLRYSSDLSTLAYVEEYYGLFLSKLGEKRRARDLYQQSYEHRLAINDVYNLQIARNDLAAMDKQFGKFQSALVMYQQLLSDGLANDDKHRQSLSLNHLGDIYRILNRLEEAIQSHSRAERLCEEIQRTDRKALAIRRLGQAYLCGWQLSKAETALNRSNVLYESNIASPRGQQRVEILLARLALCRGNCEKASNLLRETVEIPGCLQGKFWTGIALLNRGLINLSMGKLQEVLIAPTQALEIFQQEGLWRDSEAHHLLARCHLALGNLDDALDEVEQAKARFMDLSLFHRVYQAESTELHIIEARERDDFERWRVLSEEELRYDFNHLGI